MPTRRDGAERVLPVLSDLTRADEHCFGGKGASLGDLIGEGLPVPAGFAVSTEAFDAQLNEGDPRRRARRRRCGGRCRYEQLAASVGEPDPPVAVRSSARGEDGDSASFAGQQETFLWVRGADGVLAALRDCWTSLFSPPALAYRARMADAAGEPPAMGVVVQLMVNAEVSGVMFTCNPVNGDPSVVIVDASWGLGLAVVGGEVTPDNFVLSKVTGEVLRRTISDKPFEYRPRPEGGGTERLAVGEELRDVPCLDDDRLRRLVELGQTVDARAGRPQDVEWAFTRGDGELFVLQSRPVTAAGPAPEPPRPKRSAVALVMDTFGAGDPGDR